MSDPVPHPQRAVIAAALDRLAELDDRPVVEHPEVFEQLHAALAEALASVEPTPADGV